MFVCLAFHKPKSATEAQRRGENKPLKRTTCALLFVSHLLSPCLCVSVAFYSSTSAAGRIVRISKIEIIGRKRMNRNNSAKKNPIVPINIAQSHCVGLYMPHEEGRKSRCRLVTTITNRSSHIPILTITEIIHSKTKFARTFLNQRNWGVNPLQKISAQ